MKGEFEEREYQLNMFGEIRDYNSLVVLPTALGKTIIAVFLVADKVENSDGHVLFLAPSKPLVEQHAETLGEHLDAEVEVVTGETHGPDERSEAWKVGRVAAATPQMVWNDVREGEARPRRLPPDRLRRGPPSNRQLRLRPHLPALPRHLDPSAGSRPDRLPR